MTHVFTVTIEQSIINALPQTMCSKNNCISVTVNNGDTIRTIKEKAINAYFENRPDEYQVVIDAAVYDCMDIKNSKSDHVEMYDKLSIKEFHSLHKSNLAISNLFDLTIRLTDNIDNLFCMRMHNYKIIFIFHPKMRFHKCKKLIENTIDLDDYEFSYYDTLVDVNDKMCDLNKKINDKAKCVNKLSIPYLPQSVMFLIGVFGVFGIILFCGTILGIATGLTWYPYMSINVIIMAICYGGIILTAMVCLV